jgi:hypothetical protein
MARGWESKSVEEQMELAKSDRASQKSEKLSPQQLAVARKRETLLLSRKQVLAQLQASRSPVHRSMLEKALAELDKQLQQPDSND